MSIGPEIPGGTSARFPATPLIMLALLVIPYLALGFVPGLAGDPSLRGCIGLALAFGFTGVGHFFAPEPMARMIPPRVPGRVAIIYVTGVAEIVAGLALLDSGVRRAAGWFWIAFLIALLPFNIYAAMKRVPIGGHAWGPRYLWVRVPLQLVLIGWCYWFAARHA